MESVKYTLTEEEHLAFWKLQFDSSLKRSLVVLAALIAALAVASVAISGPASAVGVVSGGIAGAIIVLLLCRFVIIPYQANKVWRDFALIKEEMTLTLREEGFTIEQVSGHVDAKWSQMVAWHEAQAVFAIFVNRQLAYLIPRGQVAPEVVDFARERLIESGLTKKGARRK